VQILMFSEPSYPRHPGGAGKCSHLLAAGLVARGHTVHIICETNEEPLREQIDGVDVHRLRLSGAEPLRKDEQEAVYARSVLSYLEREIPLPAVNLVHDSGGFLSYFFPVAYELQRHYRLPYVLHFRYLLAKHHAAMAPRFVYDPFSAPVLGLESCLHEMTQSFPTRFADLVICPSVEDATFVHEAFRPASGKPAVVPDPIDVRFSTPDDGQALRRELANPGEQLVLFGGRIDSDLKGADIVLRAFKRMRQARPTLRLLLLARDSGTVGLFRRHFGPAVTPLGWIDDAARFAGVLSAADLVMMPSRYEAFGMMCAEAMAVGSPVVAAPVGGLRDMIVHGETGFLFQSPDPQEWDRELAEYALVLLSNPTLARAVGQNARRFAHERFSVDTIAARVEQLYETATAEHRRRGREGIVPPRLDREDQERYLALLEQLLGPEARPVGEALLGYWHASIEQRCLACTRQRTAMGVRRLLSLQRFKPRRLAARLTGRWRSELQEAVEEVCPLALLQKEYIRTRLRRSPGAAHTALALIQKRLSRS